MDRKRLKDISEIRAGCLFAPVAVVCLPFLVLGTVMLVLSMGSAIEQAKSNAATERAAATITKSELGQVSTGSNRTEQVAMIEFVYTRDGDEQTSDRYFPVGDPAAQRDPRGIVERLPVGAETEAWLPDDAGVPAFLEKHWNGTVYAGVGAGLFAWGFCGMLLTVCGGWRWTGRAWLGAWAIMVGILGIGGYAAWHAMTFVPSSRLPSWLIAVALGAGVSALLPVIGAWQASRVAAALREIEQ